VKPIVITSGEPAGIGPDLVIQIAQQSADVGIVVIADAELLQQRAKLLNLPLQISNYDPAEPPTNKIAGQLNVLHIPLAQPTDCGKLNKKNSTYVINTLTRAAQACLNQEFAGLVTGPVHKGIINDAGISFSGHTEFFAQLAHSSHVVMMLVADNLRVALATTHLPLSKVADAITTESLTKTLTIIQHDLENYFGIKQARIAVCGLNPHAGENGHLGREEIEIIIPTLEKLRQKGMQLMGPVPADTAFIPQNRAQSDVILAMYHDQGLPVIKQMAFDHAVNITLGLPFLRTSVDHGTALELAGTGKADTRSFLAALNLAVQILKKND
jgi:4-hydroxythreonine-4-phosphate dehydrogenase